MSYRGYDELRRGLVLHLPLSEGVGTSVKDTSQYANNGIIDGATWVEGREGRRALNFDGGNDWVNCGNGVRPISAITVHCWAKPTAFIESGTILSSGRSGGALFFWPNALDVRFYVWTTGWNYVSILKADIALDMFHSFTLTYDQNQIKIDMNGVEKDSKNVSGDITYDGKPCVLGGYVGGVPPHTPDRWFEGIIEEMRVYNRALDATERRNLHNLRVII